MAGRRPAEGPLGGGPQAGVAVGMRMKSETLS